MAPTITSGATATAIDENTGAGQVVYTATSTDNGDIHTGSTTYSLKPVNDASSFMIDANTGAVTLIDQPDYELKPSYRFTVVATDAAGNSSEQAVSLAINNLDDSAPKITSGYLATPIDENSGSGKVVYTATATDDGTFTWSLKPVADSTAFTIDPTTGAVTLTGDPNYEAKSSYSFTVVATDDAGNVSEQPVTLAINNLDEVAPTITSGATATPSTRTAARARSSTPSPHDDTGTSCRRRHLQPQERRRRVAPSRSTPLPARLPSRPIRTTKRSPATASPSWPPTPPATAVTNRPSLWPSTTSTRSRRPSPPAPRPASMKTAAPSQVVYTVTSTDNGDIHTGSTTYSLGGTDASAFTIDATTGAVTLKASPDYETKSSYSFTVMATDAAGNSSPNTPSHSAINNLDEVAPTITSGATASVNENIATSQVVYTVTSTDTGDIHTGSTTYSLGGTDASAFTINASTGEVNSRPTPTTKQAELQLHRHGHRCRRQQQPQAVALTINNLDEVAPTITSGATAGDR